MAGLALGFAAAVAHGVGDFVARFRPEPRWLRTLGWSVLGAQLVALFVAERGAGWGPVAEWIGNGSAAAFAMVAVAEAERLRRGRGALIDLPVAWLGLLALTVPLGAVGAALAVAIGGLALILTGWWRDRPDGSANAV